MHSTTYPSHAAQTATGWFNNTVATIDGYGRGAWIALMVLGFVFGGPLGLLILAYVLVTGRLAGSKRAGKRMMRRMGGSTGNLAFDAYRDATLRRLEEERAEFESFLERLREAKDKAEFDQFMDQRAKDARDATPTDDERK
ncbi:uncharacterized protein DUF2852 [Hasllibacter halocynthiae]|uniref:Uncharacterized protein DUF2852 n=1 Tax=Hasllibacter halocynthiae TaxID=595589 RepID=A0A2T0X965_9RHOB|nr:DUF2852 domain-containing protein [Hasllibacter halocynthiae]PRY95488.1 uncharacterized protein DUF2852 [Hasllibacter halocynthiae]